MPKKPIHEHDLVQGVCRLCGWDGSDGAVQRHKPRTRRGEAQADRAKRAKRRRRGKARDEDPGET